MNVPPPSKKASQRIINTRAVPLDFGPCFHYILENITQVYFALARLYHTIETFYLTAAFILHVFVFLVFNPTIMSFYHTFYLRKKVVVKYFVSS